MRVLLVEDENQLREQLAARLKIAGYVVEQADDGVQGLYLGSEFPLDVAIIDLGLPRLSGIDLIKRLRQQGKHFPR